MSFLGGLAGGSTGAGFQAKGATVDQANQANSNVQSSFDQQQALLNQLAASGGVGNQQNVFQQQQQLANQLQQQALGGGPNPALDQLNQQTGNNIAAQSALMAGQRNSGSNAGLMARQIAQQGANTQQQAVGQGATLQSQQQLAAQQQLGQQQQALGNTAQQQIGNQQAAILGSANTANTNQANLLGSIGNQNSANASVAQQNAKSQAGGLGGLISGLGSLAPLAGSIMGGPLGGLAGSALSSTLSSSGGAMAGGADASGGGGLSGLSNMATMMASKGGQVPGKAPVPGDSKKNDIVNAKLSPGELVIPRSVVQKGPEAVLAFAKKVMEQESD